MAGVSYPLSSAAPPLNFAANSLCPWCGRFSTSAHQQECSNRQCGRCRLCHAIVLSRELSAHEAQCQQYLVEEVTRRVRAKVRKAEKVAERAARLSAAALVPVNGPASLGTQNEESPPLPLPVDRTAQREAPPDGIMDRGVSASRFRVPVVPGGEPAVPQRTVSDDGGASLDPATNRERRNVTIYDAAATQLSPSPSPPGAGPTSRDAAALKQCRWCKRSFPVDSDHSKQCPQRLVMCRYCRAKVKVCDRSQHFSTCPGRGGRGPSVISTVD